MKVRSSKVIHSVRLRVPGQQGKDLSNREKGGRGSSQLVGFIANKPRRELHRSGSHACVETAAGQC